MGEYEVVITETLRKVITVEAQSLQEALNDVKADYKNGEYILDADDFVDVEFTGWGHKSNNVEKGEKE